MRLKLILTGLGLLAGLGFSGLLVWSDLPVIPDRHTPDPAVAYMNSADGSEAVFSEAYFAQGENFLHYVSGGEGDVVLFLHGFPSYWFSHLRQLVPLARDYRVVAVDGLGVGRSSAPLAVTNYSLESMAGHLLALIDHLGAQKIHLVGHDWGAVLAFGFAQRYPDRVVTVAGMSAPPQNLLLALLETSASQRAATRYVETVKAANVFTLLALDAPGRVRDGVYKPFLDTGKLSAAEACFFQLSVGSIKRLNRHINWYRANIPAPGDVQEADFWPSRLARLTVPALFIWGEDDPLITEDMILALQKNEPKLRMMMLRNAGHWPQIEKPDAVLAAISDLLESAGKR